MRVRPQGFVGLTAWGPLTLDPSRAGLVVAEVEDQSPKPPGACKGPAFSAFRVLGPGVYPKP